jgi:hypothetical protein
MNFNKLNWGNLDYNGTISDSVATKSTALLKSGQKRVKNKQLCFCYSKFEAHFVVQ